MPKLFVKKGFGIFKIIPHPKFGKVIANNNTKPRRTKFFFLLRRGFFFEHCCIFFVQISRRKKYMVSFYFRQLIGNKKVLSVRYFGAKKHCKYSTTLTLQQLFGNNNNI